MRAGQEQLHPSLVRQDGRLLRRSVGLVAEKFCGEERKLPIAYRVRAASTKGVLGEGVLGCQLQICFAIVGVIVGVGRSRRLALGGARRRRSGLRQSLRRPAEGWSG